MNRDDFQLAMSLFERVCELPPSQQEEVLRKECTESPQVREQVTRMLRSDDQFAGDSDLLVGAGAAVVGIAMRRTSDAGESRESVDERLIGSQVHGYRILRVLGAGGAGIVFEAEQDNPARRVALKVLSSGLLSGELVRRFEFEAQTLARLQHPGIARIFDAGTLDGPFGHRPYFAMELIDGVPLVQHARQHALPRGARLELFVKVCRAVQYAHQQGVIHRDLKPANILVDSLGEPTILDFGVARSAQLDVRATLQTATGQIIGTLAYMSMEQIQGDPQRVDTRADVYALGVILFELLVQRLPFDVTSRSVPEALRMVVEQEAPRLGTIDRSLSGDLESIVARTLEKEPARRYSTATALAEDIERHLRSEPVLARPATTWYKLRKFSRRNKPIVAGVGATILALVAGIVLTGWQLSRALRAERLAANRLTETVAAQSAAEAAAASATQLSQFLQNTLAFADPDTRGGEKFTVRLLLDDAAERAHAELGDDPANEASLRLTLGQAYRRLGYFTEGEEQLALALSQFRGLHGEAHRTVAEAQAELAQLLLNAGRHEEAHMHLVAVLALPDDILPADHNVRLTATNSLGEVSYAQGRFDDAERQFQDAARRREATVGRSDLRTLISLNNLAASWQGHGKLDEAEELLREIIALRREFHPRFQTNIAQVLSNLGSVLKAKGKLDEAESLNREALEIVRTRLPEGHPLHVTSLNNLGGVLLAKKDFEGAGEIAREGLELRRRIYGEEHPAVASALHNLGVLLDAQGKDQEAEAYLLDGLAMRERLLGQSHWRSGVARVSLGKLFRRQGRLGDASVLFSRALETFASQLGEDHARTRDAKALLAECAAGHDAAAPDQDWPSPPP